jgi:hypothetical protein
MVVELAGESLGFSLSTKGAKSGLEEFSSLVRKAAFVIFAGQNF